MLKKSISVFIAIFLLSISVMCLGACGPKKTLKGTEFTITFDLGECSDKGATISSPTQKVKYQEHYELIQPTCEGYEFVKWVRIVDETYELDFDGHGTYILEENIVLKAIWIPIIPEIEYHTITYVLDNPYGISEDIISITSLTQTVAFGEEYTLYDATISSKIYTFSHWIRTDTNTKFDKTGIYEIDGDITLRMSISVWVGE